MPTDAQLKICEYLARWEGWTTKAEMLSFTPRIDKVYWVDPTSGAYKDSPPDYIHSWADTGRIVERLPEQKVDVIVESNADDSMYLGNITYDGTFYPGDDGPTRLEALVNALHAYAEAGGVLEDGG